MLGTAGSKAGGQELVGPARQGSPKSCQGQQQLRGAPCSLQASAQSSVLRSLQPSRERLRNPSRGIPMKSVDCSHT